MKTKQPSLRVKILDNLKLKTQTVSRSKIKEQELQALSETSSMYGPEREMEETKAAPRKPIFETSLIEVRISDNSELIELKE